jgi:two-component system LytT family sensor kinase
MSAPLSVKSLMRSPLFLATVAIWLTSFAVWTLDAWVQHAPYQINSTVRGALCDTTGALMCWAMYLVLKRLEKRPLAVRFGVALGLAAVATAAFMSLIYWAFFMVWPLMARPPHWPLDELDMVVAFLWTFLAWCCVYFSLGLGAAARDAEALSLDSQNRMLRYQLDPHFLFNIHNALATLIHDDRNAEAERMVLALSGFLRRSLAKDPSARIPLTEELSAMREYMGVEAVRFGDRLRFVETIDAAVQDALAPSFILQPLLENCIKHGLGESAGLITIELGASREGADLKLWVQDDGAGGPGEPRATLGVGLDNVRARLQAFYGAGANMITQQRSPCGYRVTLTLPLAFA